MSNTAFIITGPTASGKSGFAHALAMRIGGFVINCDSVQIYRGIENISASPFAGRDVSDDIDGVPYRLFSIMDLDSQISVSEYLSLAGQAYDDALLQNKIPIFVGGTGYYINAIINGMSPMPDVSEDNRNLARELVMFDIDGARKMLPNDFTATDPQRVARALEVFLETGHHITEFQKKRRVGAIAPDAVRVLINPDANVLRERIAARVPEMIASGALDEAEDIIANDFDSSRAIGAAQLVDYINGKISYEKCIENWITKTNQYAKRQRTWFRTQYDADVIINHVPTDADIDILLQK